MCCDESVAVAFLGRLAGDDPALELAIGRGRVALPLAATGIGIDGTYRLVCLAYDTLFNLLTRNEQVRCF